MTRRTMATLLLATAVHLHGCMTTRETTLPTKTTAPLMFKATVRHLENEDAWDVRYQLPEPVRAVAFYRGNYEFRQPQWTVAEPSHVQLKRVQGRDFLWSASGKPFQEVTLRIKTYFRNPEKDYQVFIPYTDGGVLLYTGQFDLEPIVCSAGEICELAKVTEAKEAFHTRYTLAPRTVEHLVLLGNVLTGQTEWTSEGDGTYVYFGQTKPVQSEHVTAVIDSTLPSWLLKQTEELIPKLFAFYTNAFGTKLGFKPVVFISYGEETDPKSSSFGGGTLPGLAQLDFRLPQGHQPGGDPLMTIKASYLIAHESAHLWNRQTFSHQVPQGDWLHEGSADALAWRALRELDVISDEHYWKEQSRSPSLCLLGLEGQPLTESSRPGKFKNYYYCGATINLLIEAALRSSGSKESLFNYWARVFAVNGDGTYDDAALFKALAPTAGSEVTASLIKRLVHGPNQDVEPALRAELIRLGLTVEAASKSDDAEYERWAGFRAVKSVVAFDCGADTKMQLARTMKVPADARCSSLTAGQTLTQIGGDDVGTHGAAAYDGLVASCAASRRVKVGDETKTVEVGCAAPALLKRPAYLRVKGWASASTPTSTR